MKTGMFNVSPLLAKPTETSGGAPDGEKPKLTADQKNKIKSARAVSAVVNALERLSRKGRKLSTANKAKLFKTIDDAVLKAKKVLDGQAEIKDAGFTFDD